MSDTAYDDCWNRFVAAKQRPPLPEEKPSLHQLTAVLELLRTHCCYVDLALLGPFHIRTMKAWKWIAAVLVNGRVADTEIKGPPDFDTWLACWTVFQTCMIMAGACIAHYLESYGSMVQRLNKTYGPRCWGLLYQTENRYRHERFPDLVRFESVKAKRALKNGTWDADTHYDVTKPFEHLFRMCAGGWDLSQNRSA